MKPGIGTISRWTGGHAHFGSKYVPRSITQLRDMIAKVDSRVTCTDVQGLSQDHLVFCLGTELYYVDLLTVEQDIRALRLFDLMDNSSGD